MEVQTHRFAAAHRLLDEVRAYDRLELSWDHEALSSLDVAGAQSALHVVPNRLPASTSMRWLIVDEGVHAAPAPLGDASVWLHLEHLEDVKGIGPCVLALAVLPPTVIRCG
jgi:hypothetical protein